MDLDFALDDVRREAQRLGPIAFLATVSGDGSPHVVPIHVNWLDDELVAATGTDDRKTRNVARHSAVCLHYAVDEASGWDHLMLWGTARIASTIDEKRRMWAAMTYDVDAFEPGGPDNSPGTVFVVVTPHRAVFMRRYGLDGRREWTAG